MLLYALFKVVFGIYFVTSFVVNCTIVQTKFGPVLGRKYKSHPILIYLFKNIPYAKQPIGDLRFKLPQESPFWGNENDLNNHQSIYCPQVSSSYIKHSHHGVVGQEDCLFLDIYVRKVEAKEALPVLIYFHPGRFSFGSKEEYGPDFLLKVHEMVIVIPNYRLGILGFLSNKDSAFPENLGLWDQRIAMKWVYENIKFFGGDPQRITIAGHDAGGASVGFHILSPLSHDYFTAAISSSGTALDPWAMSHTPENVFIVANHLQCPTNSSDNMINCLKMSKINDILDVQMKLNKGMFRPTIDQEAEHPFLPFIPQLLYAKGYQKNVSYIAGVAQEEALSEVSNEFPAAVETQHLDKIIQHLLDPYLQDMSAFPLIVKAAKYHYLRGVPVPTFESIKPQMIEMMSDFLYNSPLQTTLKWHSMKTHDTFMYVLNYKDEDSDRTHILSSEDKHKYLDEHHTGDASFVFNITFEEGSNIRHSQANHVKKVLCEIWGNFIKLRSPSISNWKNYGEKEKYYAEISTTIIAKTNYRKNDMELWTLLIPDLQKIQNSSIEDSVQELLDEDINILSWGAAGLAVLLGVLCIALVGVVVVMRRKLTQVSIIPVTSRKEEIQYSSIV
ncbi:venom carboxylesterase-6 [Nephila pilipes]|uniref:Venom carboxylesterase-6 n=1 Tax=Nephila pilipes TaxID=299642 RepID=A0A8X6PER9_NEPPI|nr:venom carboxylesterase-6 [Nephila pilipes]